MSKKVTLLLGLIFCVSIVSAADDQQPTIGAFDLLQPYAQQVQLAYANIGMDVSIKKLPNERIIRMMRQGSLIGDLIRVDQVYNDTPGYVKVPVPLDSYTVELFCQRRLPRCDLELLDNPNLVIAVPVGATFVSKALQQRAITQIPVQDGANIQAFIKKRPVDLVIGITNGNRQLFFAPSGLPKAEEPIMQGSVYHYLSEKHKALLPMLTKSLDRVLNGPE